MRKLPLYLLLVLAIVVSACSRATPGVPLATSAPPETNPNPAAAQPTGTQPAGQSPTASGKASSSTMECQVVSLSPTQGATQASMFPPPSKDDYTLGSNPNAALTIIEYSDFQ